MSLLKADRIGLAILNLILDSSEARGPSFSFSLLTKDISAKIGYVSPGEIEDALLDLYHRHLIGLGRYVGKTFQPYDPSEGTEYFSYGEFRCKALHSARRRQQELSRNNRQGIFISHLSEEKPIALRLQSLLMEALSPPIPVFVSSDYRSIGSGEKWYDAILGGLRLSQVVIVMLSAVALERRWINFEAGIGMGQEAKVIPVVSRGLQKGEIGLPLGQLQARDLHDANDLHALLDDIASVCHVSLAPELIPPFLNDLQSIEGQLPATTLEVTVFRGGSLLGLCIRNTGNRPLDMVDAELLIPEQLASNSAFTSYPPVRVKQRFEEEGVRLIGYRVTTQASHQPHLGIDPLRETLLPQMGEVLVAALRISIPAQLSPDQEALPIRYRVSARQESVGPVTKCISQLERR